MCVCVVDVYMIGHEYIIIGKNRVFVSKHAKQAFLLPHTKLHGQETFLSDFTIIIT